jgi:hypothetical protein
MAAPAGATTNVYPEGGGAFSTGAEGWAVTEASCNVAAFCTASGGYDAGDGRPPGSMKAETNIGLNLVSLFKSTVTLQSPDFKVGEAGVATIHLERRFSSGSLVDLTPQLDYSVRLVDRTSGKGSVSISETVPGNSAWSGEDGAASVKAGHTYAILVSAETSSNVAGTGLLSGTTSAGFDNVSLSVDTDRKAGSGGGAGGGSLTDARLATLAPGTLVGPAKQKGKRLFVKVRCPKKVGRACRISVLGLLKKRKPATTNRKVKVAKGKTKRLVLKVKPRAKGKLASRKRLLFKVRVRAGKAQATAFKRLKLIRR